MGESRAVCERYPPNFSVKGRRQVPSGPVTETERQSLKALVGSLQYAAVSTRPDLCSKLGWLQSQINKCTISTLLEANRILHEAKTFANVAIKIQPAPLEHLRFAAFSDASFASEKVPDWTTRIAQSILLCGIQRRSKR